MPRKPKPKAAPLTLAHFERFTRAIQNDFKNLDDRVARLGGKVDDLDGKVTRIGKDVAEIREDVKNLNDLMVSKTDLRDAVREELDRSRQARDIDDLRVRMVRVEERLGLKPSRRAA
jgi:predicted  nucleic acid-binding Zn-ribbon protein